MSRAYDIANELSRCRTNIERGEFVRSVLEERTRGNGHILNLQEMDIEEEMVGGTYEKWGLTCVAFQGPGLQL